MRGAAHPERIHIVPEALAVRVERRVHGLHARDERGWVVETLGARNDFLAAHEGVVGEGEVRGRGGWVRVEGAGGGGVVR